MLHRYVSPRRRTRRLQMSSGNSSSGGIGFSTALLMIFIVLKLVGAVDWSWWWVLSPVWISFAFWFVVFGVAALVNGGHR